MVIFLISKSLQSKQGIENTFRNFACARSNTPYHFKKKF